MPENFIRCAAVKICGGKCYYGKRHPEILLIIGKINHGIEIENCFQGFADKDWNFLTRSEAFKVAKEAGQLIKDTGSRGVLYSEDLY